MGGPTVWEWMLYFIMPALLQATIISVVLSLVIWFLLKKMSTKMGSSSTGPGNATEIIRARYARGEVSRKEYEQLRDDLEAGEAPAQKERAR